MPNKKTFSRNNAIKCIKFSMENSTDRVKLPLILWGHHGVGKTEIVKQVAKDNGYNLVVLHLATQDIIDLIGRPVTKTIGDKQIQDWSVPSWLHDAVTNYEKTGMPNLFFLDEFNRGPRLVLAAMLPFLIEGILHTHHIGPRDAVIAAANPSNENYEVNELTDKALLNRLGHIVLKPTVEEYKNYLKSIGTDRWTMEVIEKNPEFAKIPDIELNFDVEPSRRSIVNVMTHLGKKEKKWITENAEPILEAYLGEDFKDKWLQSYASGIKYITLEMMRDYKTYESQITEYLTTTIDGQQTSRIDVLNKALDIIRGFIDDKKGVEVVDLDWMTQVLDNKAIPAEEVFKFISENKHIKKSMFDMETNLRLGKFLQKRNLAPISMEVAAW